jgi:hypothetical protein
MKQSNQFRLSHIALVLAVASFASLQSAKAQSATFLPAVEASGAQASGGYPVADSPSGTPPYQGNGDLELGTYNYGTPEESDIQLQYDLSSIPVGATITSATLQFTINQTTARSPGTLSVFSLLSADSGFDGNATWNVKSGLGVTNNVWAGELLAVGAAGGASVAGTDYDPAALGTEAYDPTAAVGSTVDITLTGAALQAAIANNLISLNILDNGSASVPLNSDDRVLFSLNPTLTVDYTAAAVPEPKTWALMLLGAGLLVWNLRRRVVL